VATLPPSAPSPPANSAVAATSCPGDPGDLDAAGIPAHLPTLIQLGGVAYLFVGAEDANDVGTLSGRGCIGPFELASTDEGGQAQVVYLRSTDGGPASQLVFRFAVAPTFQIEFQVIDQPQVITTGDQTYRLEAVWHASTYSSPSVILFVEDADDPAPEVVYGLDVSQTVVGDVIAEYRLPGDAEAPGPEMVTAAEQAGVNLDLTIGEQHYVLVNIHTPIGTTRNGFMTLFGTSTGSPEQVLGRDQREVELFVFGLESGPPADTTGSEPPTVVSTEVQP
jgi:hypothetical protein